MAITVKNFAALISTITHLTDKEMSDGVIAAIHEQIEDMVKSDPSVEVRVDLVPLFNALCDGKKIEAIKMYRMLTSFGLKESKNEIERLIDGIQNNQSEAFLKQLRDVLGTEEVGMISLLAIVRDAHKAEQKLASIMKMIDDGASADTIQAIMSLKTND